MNEYDTLLSELERLNYAECALAKNYVDSIEEGNVAANTRRWEVMRATRERLRLEFEALIPRLQRIGVERRTIEGAYNQLRARNFNVPC